jgi:hypothetical protein
LSLSDPMPEFLCPHVYTRSFVWPRYSDVRGSFSGQGDGKVLGLFCSLYTFSQLACMDHSAQDLEFSIPVKMVERLAEKRAPLWSDEQQAFNWLNGFT